MSKFIDLHDEIEDDLGSTRAAIERILEWLDNHPQRIPGRTITESEYNNATYLKRNVYGYNDEDFLFHFGIEVVPDPVPTNAEFIDELLTEFAQLNASCGGEQGDHDLAEFLDARGVRVTTDD